MSSNEEILNVFVQKCTALRSTAVKYGDPTVSVQAGRKYWKLVVENGGPGSTSVWAFVDKITLDVYKPASWAAPAKHARGNAKADPKLFCSWTGPHYL